MLIYVDIPIKNCDIFHNHGQIHSKDNWVNAYFYAGIQQRSKKLKGAQNSCLLHIAQVLRRHCKSFKRRTSWALAVSIGKNMLLLLLLVLMLP